MGSDLKTPSQNEPPSAPAGLTRFVPLTISEADDAGGADAVTEAYVISGYISKPEPAAGRASSDRLFLSINKRPCEHGKLSKAINEVYRQFVKNKYPVVVLDLSLPRQDVCALARLPLRVLQLPACSNCG